MTPIMTTRRLLDAPAHLSPYCPDMIVPAHIAPWHWRWSCSTTGVGAGLFTIESLIRRRAPGPSPDRIRDGFFCYMKPPFDIAGDLDTPVSAYVKLAARSRRASCSRASRAASASAATPSSASAMRSRCGSTLTASRIGAERRPVPREHGGAARGAARRARARAASRSPRSRGCRWPAASSATRPTTSCASSSACRRSRRRLPTAPPLLHYVAPRSLLVFDHLTRGIALLHAGTEAERAALRREVIAALRGPAAAGAAGPAATARRSPALGARRLHRGRAARAGVHRRGRRLPAGALVALLGPPRARSVPGVPRAASHQSVSLHVLREARRPHRGRFLARGAGASSTAGRRELRPIAGTRPRARRPRRSTSAREARAARRSEGERRARDAGGPGAQRPRARRARGQGARDRFRGDRALQPRDAHRQRRAAAGWRRGATPSTCSRRRFRRARWWARPRCGRCRSSRSSSRCGAVSTAAPSATSARAATWIRRSRSARWCSTATSTATRPAPASSPTACPSAEHDESPGEERLAPCRRWARGGGL